MVVREEERDPVRLEARLQRRLIIAVAAAWAAAATAEASGAATLVHHDRLVDGDVAPWVALPAFLLAWQVMIVAMMLPTTLPLVRLFARASAGQPRPRAAMGGFLGGYAVVWTAFAVLALALDVGIHAAVDASPWLAAHEWSIGVSVLALAGAFQFTPLKYACLDKCRHPVQFLRRFYARGVNGGFRLGARHGLFCLGCCWALMLVMFSVGVVSVLWMAALTALIVHEKTRPAGRRGVPVAGAALLTSAFVIAGLSV